LNIDTAYSKQYPLPFGFSQRMVKDIALHYHSYLFEALSFAPDKNRDRLLALANGLHINDISFSDY
jgi:hypothetical protein